jgi:hypothetical protein
MSEGFSEHKFGRRKEIHKDIFVLVTCFKFGSFSLGLLVSLLDTLESFYLTGT